MNKPYDHLTEKARSALSLKNEERHTRLRCPRWIGYTRAKKILAQLNDLLTRPRTHRMPNLLIVGDTNNGKTMLVQRFQSLHRPSDNKSGVCTLYPVMVIQSPPTPEEGRLYNAILEQLGAAYRVRDRVDKRQFQVVKTLQSVGLKMLVIDELHDILAGPYVKQRQFLNTIKYLGNVLQIPIVAVGIKEAFNALQTDPQLSNRFEPVILPKWEIGAEYLSLLASFERMLPLKQTSNLTELEMAMKLLSMSEGTIGELSSLLERAALKAIEKGTERITAKILAEVEWTPPSQRKWTSRVHA